MAAAVTEGPSVPAEAVVQRFLDAVLWAEHLTVWELFSPSAREVALAGAARRGLDSVAAERARQGTWTDNERDRLLGALVRGLCIDLAGANLEDVSVGQVDPLSEGRVLVTLEALATLPDVMTAGQGWALGRVELSLGPDRWMVERIVR